jgi:hypothetical protein
MRAKIKHFLIFVLIMYGTLSFAQKKKEIKKFGVRSITTTQIQGAKTIKDSKSIFNTGGQLTEEVKYDKDGKFVSTTKYKYNMDGDVIEETEYDEKNILREKRTMKYNALAEKTEELVSDKDGKQIKKMIYVYNSKGLRIERKTYDANNNLAVTKKIVYGYK